MQEYKKRSLDTTRHVVGGAFDVADETKTIVTHIAELEYDDYAILKYESLQEQGKSATHEACERFSITFILDHVGKRTMKQLF